jgi:uncharacterized RDD family membrane protein YckC
MPERSAACSLSAGTWRSRRRPTVGAATLLWFLGTLFGVGLGTGPRAGPWWALALGVWLVLYWSVSTVLAARTPVMLLAGLRIVGRDGTPLTSHQALVRTLCLPLSLLAFGAGAAWMVVDRERRGLHDSSPGRPWSTTGAAGRRRCPPPSRAGSPRRAGDLTRSG